MSRRRFLIIGAVVFLAVSSTLRAGIISSCDNASAYSSVTQDNTNSTTILNVGQSLQITGSIDGTLPSLGGDLKCDSPLLSEHLLEASRQPIMRMFPAPDSVLLVQTLKFDAASIGSLNSFRWQNQVPEPATTVLLGLCCVTLFGNRSKRILC